MFGNTNKLYRTGLVVGKFSPLHAGHMHLIDTALSQCEHLIILSYSRPLLIPANVREQWLKTLYPTATVHVVEDSYPVPWDNEKDSAHRYFCADLLLNTLSTSVDVVFTSELYGDGFAAYLTQYFQKHLKQDSFFVDHVLVDLERKAYPVSGTVVRDDPKKWMSMLHREVAAYYVKRILILGGESTGKTTLANALGMALQCEVVPEYGRTLYDERNGDLRYEDMTKIVETQLMLEQRMKKTANSTTTGFVICDTSPLTTMWYCEQMFGRVPRVVKRHALQERYDLVILCEDDFPFVQDGTRRDDAFRQAGQQWYRGMLSYLTVDYHIARGTLAERVQSCLARFEQFNRDKLTPQ